MRPLTTIILLAVAGLALAFIFLFERRMPGTRGTAERQRSVLQWAPAEVERIEIVNAAGRFRLDRRGETWRITEPFDDRADPAAVREVLKLVGATEVIERVAAENVQRKRDLKEFGLDAGNHVQLTFYSSKRKPVVVLVGKATAYDDSAYVRISESGGPPGDVVVARTKARPLLTRAPGEFRDPAVLESAAESLVRMVIKTPASEVELQREAAPEGSPSGGEQGLWRLTRPIVERTDPDVMDRLVAGLVSAQAQGFAQDVSQAGPPVATVTVWVKGGSAEGETLDIFGGEENQTSLVRSSMRPAVARCSPDLLALRLCNAERLRTVTLAAIDVRRLTTLTVRDDTAGPASMFFVRNRWFLANEGAVYDANRERIEKVVRLLNEAQIVQPHDEPGDLAAFGLARPILELSFGTPVHPSPAEPAPLDERNSVSLSFGEIGNRFFARWSDRPTVYRIDGTTLGEVPRGWVHYKSPRLLSFPPLNLRRLTVTHPPSPPLELAFDLANGGMWTATRGGADMTAFLDRPRLDRLVNRLSELSAHDWLVDPSPAAAALAEPDLHIRLAVEVFDENPSAATVRNVELAFASLVKGQATALYYGRATGEPHVFTMRRETFDELAMPVLLNRPEASATQQ